MTVKIKCLFSGERTCPVNRCVASCGDHYTSKCSFVFCDHISQNYTTNKYAKRSYKAIKNI